MEPKIFCQSCSMPIDSMAERGTEKDKSKSNEYCKYCYQNGVFTAPGMSLGEMKYMVTSQMKKMSVPENIVQSAVDSLANLKRWQKAKI